MIEPLLLWLPCLLYSTFHIYLHYPLHPLHFYPILHSTSIFTLPFIPFTSTLFCVLPLSSLSPSSTSLLTTTNHYTSSTVVSILCISPLSSLSSSSPFVLNTLGAGDESSDVNSTLLDHGAFVNEK